MEINAGILCCVIGIISSIGSIISNLSKDGYQARVKIKDTEIVIEKADLQKLHEEREEFHKERIEFRKEVDKLKKILKVAEKKLNGKSVKH